MPLAAAIRSPTCGNTPMGQREQRQRKSYLELLLAVIMMRLCPSSLVLCLIVLVVSVAAWLLVLPRCRPLRPHIGEAS